ncbi:NAD(P)-binding protein [Salinarimonas sp.]|uniref:NAD(P)-binding protein n=1 Tax=Salinarimonas sp. TaxID=2766526 RepID=UPI00391CFAF2
MDDRHETAQDAARSVAIVGAGLSGIVAARDLAAVGFRVRVFEKSRGVGGRMATRRGDAGAFDHGAQYMRATGADFAREVAALEAQGVLARWQIEGGVYVGMPGMSAPVKRLAEGLARENAIETGFAVAAVEGEPGRRFVRSAEGALAGRSPWSSSRRPRRRRTRCWRPSTRRSGRRSRRPPTSRRSR